MTELRIEEMIEVALSGGNGAEMVDTVSLLKAAAQEITRLRKENEALESVADAANTAYFQALDDFKALRSGLVDMCHQFAGRTENGDLWTMGMSDLESAFDVLGWPQPLCPEDQAK